MTLNEVLARIETISNAHRQINRFYYGSAVDFLVNIKDNYPAFLIEDTGGSMSISSKKTSITFKMFFVDLVNVSDDAKSNEVEVLSDMMSIAQDVLALLDDPRYDDWDISPNVTMEFHTEEFDDMVAGVSIDVTIEVDYLVDRCQAPTTGIIINPDKSMKIVYNYQYAADGSEGNILSFPLLANKYIILVVREYDVMNKAVSSPSATEYVYSVNGDFEFGNDLSENETIQILYRNI